MKVLKFGGAWCTNCKQLTEVINKLNTDVSIEEVDVDNDIDTSLLYKIRSVPTMVMVDEDGEVKRFSGMMGETQLKEWLQND